MLLSPINDNPIIPGTTVSEIGMAMENLITAHMSGEDLHPVFFIFHDLILQFPKKLDQLRMHLGFESSFSPCSQDKIVFPLLLIPMNLDSGAVGNWLDFGVVGQ